MRYFILWLCCLATELLVSITVSKWGLPVSQHNYLPPHWRNSGPQPSKLGCPAREGGYVWSFVLERRMLALDAPLAWVALKHAHMKFQSRKRRALACEVPFARLCEWRFMRACLPPLVWVDLHACAHLSCGPVVNHSPGVGNPCYRPTARGLTTRYYTYGYFTIWSSLL